MHAFVGITDYDWFISLLSIPNIDEVNFWQPSGNKLFQAIKPGELFLFKLHSPLNFIVGGGLFAHSSIIPINLAWNSFLERNGAKNLMEMKERIQKYRKAKDSPSNDYNIGCILLEQPFFFERKDWIPIPTDWSPNIVTGKTYDFTAGFGKELWKEIQLRMQTNSSVLKKITISEPEKRYGAPVAILPRLGQGSFRVIVTDAYQRRCAITRERTLPALEAAHIKPFKLGGPNYIDNGILIRSDIHRLFDGGYVTITEDYRFEVSKRIKEEYENGRDYYALNGRSIELPNSSDYRPSIEFIRWHNDNIYRT
ncbi:MAG: HNH endonuclease [Syntrophales bacterium]|jgi:putative restriction endonuclease